MNDSCHFFFLQVFESDWIQVAVNKLRSLVYDKRIVANVYTKTSSERSTQSDDSICKAHHKADTCMFMLTS